VYDSPKSGSMNVMGMFQQSRLESQQAARCDARH
jgi:hypothetical protein